MDDIELPLIPLWRHPTRAALYGSIGLARLVIRLNKHKKTTADPAAYLYVKIAKKLSVKDEQEQMRQAEQLMETDNAHAINEPEFARRKRPNPAQAKGDPAGDIGGGQPVRPDDAGRTGQTSDVQGHEVQGRDAAEGAIDPKQGS